jgi:hypothetical protein
MHRVASRKIICEKSIFFLTLFFHASIHSLTAAFELQLKGRIENYGNEKGSQESG